ncbi:MAG: hypothetical protein AAGN46_12195 [Acidobacteriota bacterium]
MSSQRAASLRRLMWEVLILALIGLVGWGAWTWNEGRWRSRLDERSAEIEAQKQRQISELRAELAGALGSEAQAVGRAFAAAIRPAIDRGEVEAVDRAVVELLFLPHLSFVHVLEPTGRVLVSSDRKLIATGRIGTEASWALAAAEPIRRSGPDETVEVAVPITGSAQAVLWLGYRRAASGAAGGSVPSRPPVAGDTSVEDPAAAEASSAATAEEPEAGAGA